MSKFWKAGDIISFTELNDIQEKADKYDALMAESLAAEPVDENKPEATPVDENKPEATPVDKNKPKKGGKKK